MNPSRKKVPYPFCRISDINKYTNINCTGKSDRSSDHEEKDNNTTAFVTSMKTNPNEMYAEHWHEQLSEHSIKKEQKIQTIQEQREMNEQIILLVRENTSLLGTLTEYDNQIQMIRKKLNQIQQDHTNDLILRNQQLNEWRFPLKFLEEQYSNSSSCNNFKSSKLHEDQTGSTKMQKTSKNKKKAEIREELQKIKRKLSSLGSQQK